MAGRTRFLDSRTGVSVRMAAGLVRLTHYRYFLKSARAPKIPFPAPERYYPHARIQVFHHSGPEIPGSAREGKPRSFFLCFRGLRLGCRGEPDFNDRSSGWSYHIHMGHPQPGGDLEKSAARSVHVHLRRIGTADTTGAAELR